MRSLILFLFFLCLPFIAQSQNRSILVPKPVSGAPFLVFDKQDLFGQSYRWFIEGDYRQAADSLKQLVKQTGFELDENAYYMVVANFSDNISPIGLFHGSDDFFSTRMYGLDKDNLYYIYISRENEGKSFVSLMATAKNSPFIENLPLFIGLFQPLPFTTPQVVGQEGEKTYIDIRQFEVPKAFRKFSDLSIIVKKELSDDSNLTQTVFDNTSKEHFGYGIATALTSVNDVDFVVGNDGRVTVRPKPGLDPAVFAVVNYHFKAIDSKMTTFGNSFNILAGLRLIDFLEPIVGLAGGFDMGQFAVHLFAGYSVEFAQVPKSNYGVGEAVEDETNPFKLKLRGKPRFGLEIKFP